MNVGVHFSEDPASCGEVHVLSPGVCLPSVQERSKGLSSQTPQTDRGLSCAKALLSASLTRTRARLEKHLKSVVEPVVDPSHDDDDSPSDSSGLPAPCPLSSSSASMAAPKASNTSSGFATSASVQEKMRRVNDSSLRDDLREEADQENCRALDILDAMRALGCMSSVPMELVDRDLYSQRLKPLHPDGSGGWTQRL